MNNTPESDPGIRDRSTPRTPLVLLSIVFIILVAFSVLGAVSESHYILGAMGLIDFAFIDPATELTGDFIFCLGPLFLVTFLVGRSLQRQGGNPVLYASITTAVVSAFVGLASLSDIRSLVAFMLVPVGIAGALLSRRKRPPEHPTASSDELG